MGLNIHFQEPLLGENVGLSSDKSIREARYNGLWADYMQISTTGRRIQLDVRVWNDGVAFRYIVPKSALLLDLLLEDDATQFHFAQDAVGGRPAEASGGWVGIYEQPMAGFPPMRLIRSGARLMLSHLPGKPHDPGVAFEGSTPWTGPWRIVVIGPDRERLAHAEILRDLAK